MKNLTKIIPALAIAAALLLPASAQSAVSFDLSHPYLGLSGGISSGHYNSGGYNTVGGFSNTGTGIHATPTISGICGLDELVQFAPNLSLRGEIEFNDSRKNHYDTTSLSPLQYAGTSHSYGALVNAYVDYKLNKKILFDKPTTVFAGLGMGAFRSRITADDGVVTAEGADTRFAYQFGIGAKMEVKPGVNLSLSSRYIDMGKTTVGINGGAGGTFSIRNTAIQSVFGVTVSFDAIKSAFAK